MQLQIECNETLHQQKFCWMCDQLFETKEAKIIVCNDQGNRYGEVCPECLGKGFNWLNRRFELMNQPKQKLSVRRIQKPEVEVSVSA